MNYTMMPSMGVLDIKHESKIGQFIWVYIWTPLNLISTFVPLIVLNILQFPSLLIRPFSLKLFRKYNQVICYLVWGWWAVGLRDMVGVKFVYSGDQVPDKENAIVLSNHQSAGDIIVMITLAHTKGRVSAIKWMLKDALKYVPGIGWGLLFLENIFLKRNWADDSKNIKSTFKNIVDGNVPIWMILYPEGTRATPAKIAANTEYAKSKNMTPTKNLMFPRTKGFVAALEGLEDHIDAVYSTTIGYKTKIPTLIETMRGDAPVIHLHIRRFPIKDLPTGQKERSAWLLEEFYLKDRLLEDFKTNGTFQSTR